MRREELIGHVRRLGQAFVERDMTSQARKLRVYYLALKYRLTECCADACLMGPEASYVMAIGRRPASRRRDGHRAGG